MTCRLAPKQSRQKLLLWLVHSIQDAARPLFNYQAPGEVWRHLAVRFLIWATAPVTWSRKQNKASDGLVAGTVDQSVDQWPGLVNNDHKQQFVFVYGMTWNQVYKECMSKCRRKNRLKHLEERHLNSFWNIELNRVSSAGLDLQSNGYKNGRRLRGNWRIQPEKMWEGSRLSRIQPAR